MYQRACIPVTIAAAFLSLMPGVYGQDGVFSVGPRIGLNISNVSNLDDTKALTGIVGGLTSTYSISETSGITLDILYSQEGYESSSGQEVSLDYLQIPVYFNLFLGELGQALRPKVYIGVAPGFLLSAEADGNDVDDVFSGITFSVTGGAGINYRLADRVWLNADVRSFLGLTDIREEEFQDDETVAARNVQISVGVAFGLSRLD